MEYHATIRFEADDSTDAMRQVESWVFPPNVVLFAVAAAYPDVVVSEPVATGDGGKVRVRRHRNTPPVVQEPPPQEGEPITYAPLIATFDWRPKQIEPLAQVDFDASLSSGDIASYEWSFGDGQTDTRAAPKMRHTYQDAGEYLVTLTLIGVTPDDGTAAATHNIVVANTGGGTA